MTTSTGEKRAFFVCVDDGGRAGGRGREGLEVCARWRKKYPRLSLNPPPLLTHPTTTHTHAHIHSVVSVLMKVVDGMTVDDAVNVMNEAHTNGLACVIVCSQTDAERYCEGLRGNGLISSIEPAGGGGGKGGGEPA